MDIVAIIVSLSSLITSLVVLKKLSGPIKVDITLPKQEIQVIIPYEAETLELSSEEPMEPLPKTESDNQSRFAWKNQTGIPIGVDYAPSPGIAPPKSGPMQRPSGFYR